VLIVYQTAVADADGQVRYFNDVYGHDSTLGAAMRAAR
jgi:murein L,D-transpeptidase YcbB/YkuD